MNDDEELHRWNQRFSAQEYIFGADPNRFLASQRELLRPGQCALCVADGEGRNSVWLAQQGLDVTAFDVSPVGVEKARRLAAERGVHVHYDIASAYDWAWPEAAFDIVAASAITIALIRFIALCLHRQVTRAPAEAPAGVDII